MGKCFRKAWGAIPFCLLTVAIFSGCGQQPRDDWYEYSANLDERERVFVEQQMQSGMTELEAKRAFGLRYSIEQTEGRVPAGPEP